MKRFLKIFRIILLSLLGLVAVVALLLTLAPVQTWLAKQAAGYLSRRLKTEVRVESLRVRFLNEVELKGLYVEDRGGDTLLWAGEAHGRITDWFFLKDGKPVVSYMGLQDAVGRLHRGPKDSVWNHQFIVDAFATGKKDKTRKNAFEMDLEVLDVQRLRFAVDDAWAGRDMHFSVGSLQLRADEVDLIKRRADVDSIFLRGATLAIRDYPGGHPKDTAAARRRAAFVDTTAFNKGGWSIATKSLRLMDCAFVQNSNTAAPLTDLFDNKHIGISALQLHATGLRVAGDTLIGRIAHLSGNERCGLEVTSLSAALRLSPREAVLDSLLLQTPRSVLRRYYAMHYQRFPDFKNYIHAVRMEAHFSQSRVDSRDIAYFAAPLRKMPMVVNLSVDFNGRVDSFFARNLAATDGTSTLRGDVAMIGLPAFKTTFINWQRGEATTSSAVVLRYAPALRNSKAVSVESLGRIAYRGSFTGYPDRFAASGVLSTALGTVRPDVKMSLPAGGAGRATYAGTVSAQNFQLGTLLRRTDLGAVSFTARLKGQGFDARTGSVTFSAAVGRLGFKGYDYRGIQADGTLAGRAFTGKALVDDPNLALNFDGTLDFSGPEPVIAAKAYLLNSDFLALNLVKDSLRLSADFDLSTTGASLDDFIGTARLYNINLSRAGARVDLDSVQAVSSFDGGVRELDIQSNVLSARLSGAYYLSDLPASVQHYLAGYLPAYIRPKSPYRYEQDLSFSVHTRAVDALLATLAPTFRGFDSSTIAGRLNTAAQQLSLSAAIPAGRMGGVAVRGAAINASGNFRKLDIGLTARRLSIGDSVLNIGLNATASLGADSLRFAIATTSPGALGTATLNGSAYARADSLYGTFQPSEIFLGSRRWEIPDGARVVLAKRFLAVQHFVLQAGLQRLAVSTPADAPVPGQSLAADISALDLSEAGALVGLSALQPDGRLAGRVRVDRLFNSPVISADVVASSVRLGPDTFGNVVLLGDYDSRTKALRLSPGSGLFRGLASLRASGTLASDSTKASRLDGSIVLDNAPLLWIRPFTTGLMSEWRGTMNGSLQVRGTGRRPVIDGAVALRDAGMRVDFTGVRYRIPLAGLRVDESRISIDSLPMVDRYGNRGQVTGYVGHSGFKDFRFNLNLVSDKIEAVSLRDFESKLFYGEVTASAQVSMRGPLSALQMDILASPAGPSHLYLPIGTTSTATDFSHVTFKSYGEAQRATVKKSKVKLSTTVTAVANPMAEVTMILDPATGDAINATGTGSVRIEVPSGGAVRMFGNYGIERGDYTFTLKQVAFQRRFLIDRGSSITFNGPITKTSLGIKASYPVTARLSDLLTANEISILDRTSQAELRDARQAQRINLLVNMGGTLVQPTYTFSIEPTETRSIGTVAYTRLQQVNSNDRDLLNQVGSLLLIGSFVTDEGIGAGTASRSVLNNISEILSSTASGSVTNLVNRITGDQKLAVDVKYRANTFGDATGSGIVNRNEFQFGLRRNFLDDRLVVEVGSVYDWGRPTGTVTRSTTFTPVGNFRAQYILSSSGRYRLNVFRTQSYDVLVNDQLWRGGVGFSYRRTFNNISDLWRSSSASSVASVPNGTPLPLPRRADGVGTTPTAPAAPSVPSPAKEQEQPKP